MYKFGGVWPGSGAIGLVVFSFVEYQRSPLFHWQSPEPEPDVFSLFEVYLLYYQ